MDAGDTPIPNFSLNLVRALSPARAAGCSVVATGTTNSSGVAVLAFGKLVSAKLCLVKINTCTPCLANVTTNANGMLEDSNISVGLGPTNVPQPSPSSTPTATAAINPVTPSATATGTQTLTQTMTMTQSLTPSTSTLSVTTSFTTSSLTTFTATSSTTASITTISGGPFYRFETTPGQIYSSSAGGLPFTNATNNLYRSALVLEPGAGDAFCTIQINAPPLTAVGGFGACFNVAPNWAEYDRDVTQTGPTRREFQLSIPWTGVNSLPVNTLASVSGTYFQITPNAFDSSTGGTAQNPPLRIILTPVSGSAMLQGFVLLEVKCTETTSTIGTQTIFMTPPLGTGTSVTCQPSV